MPKIQAADPLAYMSTYDQDYIAILNSSTGERSRLANAGINATNFAVSPDGTTAYVASDATYLNQGSGISVINLATGKITGEITAITYNDGTDIAISPDGSFVYLANGSYLSAISSKTLSIVNQAPLQLCPCQVIVTPDGSRIYAGTTAGLNRD